jgi:hypothetical protein
MMTMMAAAATIATAAASMAAAAAMTSDGLVGTADEGDSDDRDKHREAEKQCPIHPRILQLTGNLA